VEEGAAISIKRVQATADSLRSVRCASDMAECGNTFGYTGPRCALGAKPYSPLSGVRRMHRKEARRRRVVSTRWRWAER